MFWGLNLKPNRKYTQTASKSFHISQAALDVDSADGGASKIFISCENQKFLICTLRKGACEQVMLDLNFAEGDEICFQSIGSGNVSLSGYLIVEDSMDLLNGEDGSDDSEMENQVEDLRNALLKKQKGKKAEGTTGEEKEDEDEEDDSDFNLDGTLEGTEEDSDEEEDDEEEDDDDEEEDDDDDEEEDDEDEEEDEEVEQPKAKQPKLDKQAKQQNGVAATAEKKSAKKDKKDKQKEQPQQQQQQQKQKPAAGGERSLSGGVKVEDIRVGAGPEAKTGKRAQVYYIGRLKSNNKVFDSLSQGAPFKFGIGRGEVIKGWDIGVAGMKVGGKRRITCPPHMAYGARGSPPTIPPNSTLVFEVELKGVN